MKLHVLGSNGWYDTGQANTLCMLLETDDFYVVFDAGGGLYKLDEFVKTDKPIYLFLSHFHLDHIIGFHSLPKFNFSQGLTIFGQPGTKEILDTYINSPFTMPMEKLPYKVTVRELPEGDSGLSDAPFPIESEYLVHSDPSFGYRLVIEDKVIAFCTDTGYCDNLVKLATDADLFITECALGIGQLAKPEWPHLNPETAARVAKDAKAKKLLLTHFGASTYLTDKDREEAKVAAEEIYSPVVVANDGLELDI